MTTPNSKPRWYHFTPDRLILALLAVEGLLWLSDRFGWPVWHKGYAVLTTVAAVGVALVLMVVWFAVALSFHWRFQFSIRTLLVLVVVVAVPSSWFSWEMKKVREQKEAVDELEKGGCGVVEYDYEFDSADDYATGAEPPGPPMLRNLLGDGFFAHVHSVCLNCQVTDATWVTLKKLPRLSALNLNPTNVTDAELDRLKDFTQLQRLYLFGTQVTDAGLECLKGLTQFQQLDLFGTHVTDAGLERLRGLSQIQVLDLFGTHVTRR